MGDVSPIEQLGLAILMAGFPALLFGLPIAALVCLSIRRRQVLAEQPGASASRLVPLLWGWLLFLAIGLGVYLLTAVGFTT